MIIAVSHAADEHAAVVLRRLAEMGADAWLLDLSTFPRDARLAIAHDRQGRRTARFVAADGREVDFANVNVVWWRRPQDLSLDPAIVRPSHRIFGYNESHEALAGLWQSLDAFWVNHPTRTEVGARKVLQLQVAAELGLDVPETLITNDPAEARRFIDSRPPGTTICKAFSATEAMWRETRLVSDAERAVLDNVTFAPVIFQGYVDGGADIRVTVVGDAVFAAAIHAADSSYPVDFRMDMASARVEAHALPADLTATLLRLTERLGLVYGAIDLRRTTDGRYVFLEINPAGQWLFVEQRTGQPISAAVAELLASHDE